MLAEQSQYLGSFAKDWLFPSFSKRKVHAALLNSQCWHTMVLKFPFHSCPPPRLVALWLTISLTVYPSTGAWQETGEKVGHPKSLDISAAQPFQKSGASNTWGHSSGAICGVHAPLGAGHLKIRPKLRPGKSPLWPCPKWQREVCQRDWTSGGHFPQGLSVSRESSFVSSHRNS